MRFLCSGGSQISNWVWEYVPLPEGDLGTGFGVTPSFIAQGGTAGQALVLGAGPGDLVPQSECSNHWRPTVRT